MGERALALRSAVVIGGASCVWTDLEAAKALGDYNLLIAINDAGAEYPGTVDYWISLHPEKMAQWARKRAENGYQPARQYVAHIGNTNETRRDGGFRVSFSVPYTWHGSSGLFACEIALKTLEVDRVVLCGVPMTADPHFFDSEPWNAVKGFWDAWPAALPHIKDKVRSMSGRTKELLGAPTRQWLTGAE